MPEQLDSQERDADWMDGVRRRDPQALIDLYNCYGKRVFSLIYRIVKDRGAAEELVQDTFLRLWDRADQYDPEKGALLSWLYRVGRNCALDFLRKESRRVPLDVDLNENLREAGGRGEGPEQAYAVRIAVLSLPAEQREVLELAYFEGLTHSELVQRTGESLGTVKSRIRLGIKKLRSYLQSGAKASI
jgi:RNA polymerase sigma-70 factor (ECF subfamily)